MPKLSICIPAYNQVEHLKKTIDSVLSQTYTDYEIIITDDTPGNGVKNFVAQYNLPDKIKYFKNVLTLGSPENWNEALRRSTGQYIKILHHDDWLNYEDSLAKYVALLDNNPGSDFAFSATQAIDPGKKNWVHAVSMKQLENLKINPLLLYSNNLIGAPSTGIFRRNNDLLFDPNLKWLVDIDYYLRQLNKNKNIVYSPELLTVTFLAAGRITNECIDNKEVEVYEYLYVLESIYKNYNKYSTTTIRPCLLKAIAICDKYKINSVQNIKDCGYKGHVPFSMKLYWGVRRFSSSLGKLYLKLLQKL